MENTAAKIMSGADAMQAEGIEGKYLTFITDEQMFGVPIADVVQIVEMQEVTQIPEFPVYAKGVINLRGSIIPVIDIRLRLGKPETEYTDRTCVIVSNIHDRFFGFIVDEVDEVTDIPDSQISPPPQMGGEFASPYITGVARIQKTKSETIVLLMDPAKILGDNEFDLLAQAAN